ncbi:MAG: TlpA family protein disulfide reductase [Acidimicrobiales bacterium]|nr:TlpA family protein disulfide reductase [Acidimicrobiales bacterium]
MKTVLPTARKPRFLLAILALVISAAACSSAEASLPDNSEIFSATGSSHTLEEFRGSPVVLNFFAAWCPPCRAEMPDFESVSRARDGEVQFVGLSRDFSTDAWLEVVETTGVTFPTYSQPSEELFLASGGLAMPTTVFLDSEGKVKRVHSGPLSMSRLDVLIDELLLVGP